jgi:hypothetical protein
MAKNISCFSKFKFFKVCSNKESICPLQTNTRLKKTRYSHKRRREQDQRKVGRKSRTVEM